LLDSRQTYSSRGKVAPGKSLITVLCDFLGLIIVNAVIFHRILQILEVLGCFDIVGVGSGDTEKMCMEFLPLERVCDECRAAELKVLEATGIRCSFGLDGVLVSSFRLESCMHLALQL
jgi:hypothetical protein